MKKYLFLILSLIASSTLAQDVWTEGTIWKICYNKEGGSTQTTFELTSSVEVEGTAYYPLTETTDGGCRTVAYIRSERGDSLVYARVYDEGKLQPDILLYDFTKSFEYGDAVRYGTKFGVIDDYIMEGIDTIFYLHDIIEKGDCIPVWNNLIYKLGSVKGPLAIYFLDIEIGDSNNPNPKTTNVSHILFGTRKGAHAEIDFDPATGIVRRITLIDKDNHIYDLQGRRLYSIPEKGIYIRNGKRYIR